MNIFDNFPYSNLQELNLDWLIEKVKELEERVTALEQENAQSGNE